jgi:putative photosynthetic complex assembly protein
MQIVMSAIDLQPFPRWPLIAAGALIVTSITLTAVVRISNWDAPSPAARADAALPAAIASRTLTFTQIDSEGLLVRDDTGREVARLAVSEAGFVHGVMRGLRRGRTVHNAPTDPTVTLAVYPDGRFLLTDTAADSVIDLNAFGADNRKAFAVFLPQASLPSTPTAPTPQGALP